MEIKCVFNVAALLFKAFFDPANIVPYVQDVYKNANMSSKNAQFQPKLLGADTSD